MCPPIGTESRGLGLVPLCAFVTFSMCVDDAEWLLLLLLLLLLLSAIPVLFPLGVEGLGREAVRVHAAGR